MKLIRRSVVLTSVITALLTSWLAHAADKPQTEAAARPAIKNVGVEEFDKLRKEKEVVVLDVRTPEEVAKARIPGSVVIDFNSDNFDQEVAKLDKSKTYLVHCAAGGRSARACKKMEKLKFVKLYNLEGGMGAWEKAGKPVEKGSK